MTFCQRLVGIEFVCVVYFVGFEWLFINMMVLLTGNIVVDNTSSHGYSC